LHSCRGGVAILIDRHNLLWLSGSSGLLLCLLDRRILFRLATNEKRTNQRHHGDRLQYLGSLHGVRASSLAESHYRRI
jgi:hypothetical protein